jgi:hypothetical protein
MQSKVHSFFESVTNQVIGFMLALFMYHFIVPVITGIPTNTATSITVVLMFTALSIFRSYIIRRIFNKKTVNQLKKQNKIG